MSYEPQIDLVGKRFRPLKDQHPKKRGRIAVVLRVRSSQSTGCGVALVFRYEDSPPGAQQSVSQRWFLANYAPIDQVAAAAPTTEAP